jgi:hypothetical protein
MAKGRIRQALGRRIRWLNNLALGALIPLWVLSHWQGLGFAWQSSRDQSLQYPTPVWRLHSTAGCVVLTRDQSRSLDPPLLQELRLGRRLSFGAIRGWVHMSERYFYTSLCGFGYLMAARQPTFHDDHEDPTSRAEVFDRTKPTAYVAIKAPYWFLVAVTAATPLRAWMHQIRGRNRSRVGLCPACGYDVRATPDRCPECGHTPSPSAR